MIFNRPAAKSGPLFDLIGRYLDEDKKPDAMALARMRREAADVQRNVNVAVGHLLYSGIAALQWDVESATSHLSEAMRHSSSLDTCMNALVTLGALGRPDLAETYARLAFDFAPSRGDVVNEASGVLIALGQVKDAAEMQAACARLNPAASFEINALELRDVMERVGISEEWLSDELKVVHEVLFDTQTRIRAFHYEGEEDPDGLASLSIEFRFLGSLEDEFALEDELAVRLAVTDRWNPARLSVHTRYVNTEENAIDTV